MEIRRFEFLLRAQQPISHLEGTEGNHGVFMRRKVTFDDGTSARVPIITGQTMKHGLREAAAYAMLDAAGLLGSESLSRSACRLLFNGGALTGRGDSSAINLDRYRELCEICPPLALLGGCSDGTINPSRVVSEDALLVCDEHRDYLPQWVQEPRELQPSNTYLEAPMRVQMDPSTDPTKVSLLLPGERQELTKQLMSRQAAHESDDAVERDESKLSMRPHTFECVIRGSLFSWATQATCLTDLEIDTYHVILGSFLARPVVGGKKSSGHGLLKVVEARGLNLLRPIDNFEVTDALGGRMGSLFRDHVQSRKEQFTRWLREAA